MFIHRDPEGGIVLKSLAVVLLVGLVFLGNGQCFGQEPKIRARLTGHTQGVLSVAFSPDSRMVASGSWDKTIKLWEVATGKERATLAGHTNEVASVAFSPNGKLLASGSFDKTIKLWDVATGKEYVNLEGHAGVVRSVAFSPANQMVASGGYDKTIKLWDVATGKELATQWTTPKLKPFFASSPPRLPIMRPRHRLGKGWPRCWPAAFGWP